MICIIYCIAQKFDRRTLTNAWPVICQSIGVGAAPAGQAMAFSR